MATENRSEKGSKGGVESDAQKSWGGCSVTLGPFSNVEVAFDTSWIQSRLKSQMSELHLKFSGVICFPLCTKGIQL